MFSVLAFFLLGIERFLYGYVYHFPKHFKAKCKNGFFGSLIDQQQPYWKSFMTLGIYVKVFQYSVVLYDIFVRSSCSNPLFAAFEAGNSLSVFVDQLFTKDGLDFWLGLCLAAVGQILNASVFYSLGEKGVYYGYELGYEVKLVTSFPYNMGMSDPQYWGVVLTVWGIYIGLGVSSWTVAFIETFWYVMSMKVIESPRGGKLLRSIGVKKEVSVKKVVSVKKEYLLASQLHEYLY